MKTHNITILGVDLLMADSDDSVSVPLIAKDMNDDVYGLTVTHFQEGDLVEKKKNKENKKKNKQTNKTKQTF